ncbi:unnamed protein product [Microthlaspi erraticum]|uniref:Uncharacterized protein n=1 Tax=Microthlaspi erraticum TaxID=1685480 RepID=A0A6D2IT02_9BRAS|nr:unnamed protein product [Microthlaspi erraticum]
MDLPTTTMPSGLFRFSAELPSFSDPPLDSDELFLLPPELSPVRSSLFFSSSLWSVVFSIVLLMSVAELLRTEFSSPLLMPSEAPAWEMAVCAPIPSHLWMSILPSLPEPPPEPPDPPYFWYHLISLLDSQ